MLSKLLLKKKKEIKILISYVGRKLYPSSQIGAYDHGWLGVSLILVVFLVIKKCNKNIFIVQMQISKLSRLFLGIQIDQIIKIYGPNVLNMH